MTHADLTNKFHTAANVKEDTKYVVPKTQTEEDIIQM